MEESVPERQKKEIREQIKALQELAERLPGSKDEALAQLDALEKNIRIMQKGEQEPQKAEDETYFGP